MPLSGANERRTHDEIARAGETRDAFLAAHGGDNRFQSEKRLKAKPLVDPVFSPLALSGLGRVRQHTWHAEKAHPAKPTFFQARSRCGRRQRRNC